MNDFHGRISNTTGDAATGHLARPDGGYGRTADPTTVERRRLGQRGLHRRAPAGRVRGRGRVRTLLFVGAGDLISASPFESSVFKDEPTIEVLNAMGLDVSSVGNHEFDRGTQELRRISAATDGTYTDNVTACQGIIAGRRRLLRRGRARLHGRRLPLPGRQRGLQEHR